MYIVYSILMYIGYIDTNSSDEQYADHYESIVNYVKFLT